MRLKLDRRSLLVCLAAAMAPGVAPADGPDLNEREFNLLRRVNEMRRERGLTPLALRLDLSQAARGYAKQMAEGDFFSHVAPDGSGPTARAEAVGYDWRRLGETLAAGQRTAAAAAESWRDSPGHAKIIFDPEHRHVGVGFWRRPSPDREQPGLERFWVLLAGDLR